MEPRGCFRVTLPTLLSLAVLMSGCHSTQAPRAASTSGNEGRRNNAASLLYDLLGDERNVSKLLIIKRDRRELVRVLKNRLP